MSERTIIGWAKGVADDGTVTAYPVYADLQVEHDGLRLGVCLAIADRLDRFPDVVIPGLRTGLTIKQREAVAAYRAQFATEPR